MINYQQFLVSDLEKIHTEIPFDNLIKNLIKFKRVP